MHAVALSTEPTDPVDALLADFVEAARGAAQRDLAALLGRLEPTFREWTMVACARNRRLLEKVGLTPDEVYTLVLERAYARPPTNPKGTDPRRAVRAWITTVAVNVARDEHRRRERERRRLEAPPKPIRVKPRDRKAREIETLVGADAAEWCADNRLARRKYLREVFVALRRDVYVTGMELARAAGLVDDEKLDALPEEARMEEERKLGQHAWKLRERACKVLKECLAEWLRRGADHGEPS